MTKSINIAKIIVINLIPIIGFIWFEWSVFEMVVVFLLETCAIYFVHEIDRYFINKKTRFPFIFALIQFAFSIPMFGGLMFGYSILAYSIVGEHNAGAKVFDQFIVDLFEINLGLILVVLMTLEGISVISKNLLDPNHQTVSYWRMLRRVMYTHLYLIGAIFVLLFSGAFLYSSAFIIGLAFVVGFKIVMDYLVEDELAWTKFKHWLKSKLARKK